MANGSYIDIAEQASSLRETIEALEGRLPHLDGQRTWLFTGCGASYHAGTTAATMMRATTGLPSSSAPAAEVWMNTDIWVKRNCVVVALSRTGTTTETVQALRSAKRAGATTVGFTLTADSSVQAEPDFGISLDHVVEQGRVMTRSFSNLLLGAELLAFQAEETPVSAMYRRAARSVPEEIELNVTSYIEAARTAAKVTPNHVVFLGSGPNIGLCTQAALQLQETSRLPVEAHSVLDYRHGPIAALGERSLVVIITSARSLPADVITASDVVSTGASLLVVGSKEHLTQFPASAMAVAVHRSSCEWLVGNAVLPLLQLLAYEVTLRSGSNPEEIRNLSRRLGGGINPHVLSETLL